MSPVLLLIILNINDKTWCVGGKHYSNTNNISQYEKVKFFLNK